MKILLKAYRFLGPYKLHIALLVFINIAISGLEIIPAFIYRNIFNIIVANPTDPSFFRPVLLSIGVYAGIQVLVGLLYILDYYYSITWRNSVRAELTRRVTEEVYALQQKYFLNNSVGEIIERMNFGIGNLSRIFFFYPRSLVAPLSKGIFSITAIATIDPLIAGLLALFMPPYLYFHRKRLKLYEKIEPLRREQEEKASGKLTETLYSIESSRVNSSPSYIISRVGRFLAKSNEFLHQRLLKEQQYAFFTDRLEELIVVCALALTAYFIFYRDFSIGSLVMVTYLSSYLLGPLKSLLRQQIDFKETAVGLVRFFDMLEYPKEESLFENRIKPIIVSGKVEFKNVWFSYDNQNMILKNVSFAAGSGMTVALVGPSGSGKTTLTKLISGLFLATKGEILIDDIPITEYDIKVLRKHIAVVFQEPFIFSDTLKNNLRFANPKASDKSIKRAAKLANIDEFIDTLPQGINTQVGERGVRLSGGQKQRVAIAQAFLKNASIIIFDEATSSLDAENERLIKEAMRRLMKDRTTFIISHRLATVLHADTILVLKNGKITEQGTHEELKKAGGLYDKLYALQVTDPGRLKEVDLVE